MEHKSVCDSFLALQEDTLHLDKRQALLNHIAGCASCKNAFGKYHVITELEKLIATSCAPADPALPVIIMDRIEDYEKNQLVPEQIVSAIRWLVGGLVTANAVMLVVFGVLLGQHWSNNSPAARSNTIALAQNDAGGWPQDGFRRVSVAVDTFPSLTNLILPNSHVEILWNSNENGKQVLIPIERFARILQVERIEAGAVGEEKPKVVVTVLVSELVAEKLDLAQDTGGIVLAAISPATNSTAGQPLNSGPLRDPVGRIIDPRNWAGLPAILYTNDSRSGKKQRYVHRDGQWIQESGLEVVDL